jgi:hypothetical protein
VQRTRATPPHAASGKAATLPRPGLGSPAIFATVITYIGEEWASTTIALIMSIYASGTVGGVLPAVAWNLGKWPACVALTSAVLVVILFGGWAGFRAPHPPRTLRY